VKLKSAWLVTWEWSHDGAAKPQKVVAVINYRKTGAYVRDLIEYLYAYEQYSPGEKARWFGRTARDNPYPARFARTSVECLALVACTAATTRTSMLGRSQICEPVVLGSKSFCSGTSCPSQSCRERKAWRTARRTPHFLRSGSLPAPCQASRSVAARPAAAEYRPRSVRARRGDNVPFERPTTTAVPQRVPPNPSLERRPHTACRPGAAQGSRRLHCPARRQGAMPCGVASARTLGNFSEILEKNMKLPYLFLSAALIMGSVDIVYGDTCQLMLNSCIQECVRDRSAKNQSGEASQSDISYCGNSCEIKKMQCQSSMQNFRQDMDLNRQSRELMNGGWRPREPQFQ